MAKNLKPDERAAAAATICALYGNGTHTLYAACKLAGVSSQTHYDWLDASEEYAKAFALALRDRVQVLEDEAHRRAFMGVEKPIYQGGKRVDSGDVREFSDVLLIFLLKGAKPEKYRDNYVAKLGDGAGAESPESILRSLAAARGFTDDADDSSSDTPN